MSVRLGRLQFPAYGLMLYAGCVAGVLAGAAWAESTGLAPRSFALVTILLLVPAFAGARLWFVAQHFGAFRADPRRIWRRGEGGSSLYGGLVLAVACSVPVLAIAGVSFGRFWDAAAITMLAGLILTRFGCLLNGCCGGRPTEGPLGLCLADAEGSRRRRYPTQLLEAGWAALILGACLALGPGSLDPGALFAGVVAAYATGRLMLEPTRESARPGRERRVNMAFSAALLVAVGFGVAGGWIA